MYSSHLQASEVGGCRYCRLCMEDLDANDIISEFGYFFVGLFVCSVFFFDGIVLPEKFTKYLCQYLSC